MFKTNGNMYKKNVFGPFLRHFLRDFRSHPLMPLIQAIHVAFTESHSEAEYLFKVEVKTANSSGVMLNWFFHGF